MDRDKFKPVAAYTGLKLEGRYPPRSKSTVTTPATTVDLSADVAFFLFIMYLSLPPLIKRIDAVDTQRFVSKYITAIIS